MSFCLAIGVDHLIQPIACEKGPDASGDGDGNVGNNFIGAHHERALFRAKLGVIDAMPKEDQRKREYECQNQPVLQHDKQRPFCIPRHPNIKMRPVPNRTHPRDHNDPDEQERRQFFGP
jgi:hypothetical protein